MEAAGTPYESTDNVSQKEMPRCFVVDCESSLFSLREYVLGLKGICWFQNVLGWQGFYRKGRVLGIGLRSGS